jgi:hypothetical protein
MGHFFLGFDVRICSSELTHMKMIFLLPDMCTPKENNFDFLNQNLFPGFEGTHGCSMCKSVISKLLILVVDSQEKNLHHQMGVYLRYY